MPTDPDQALNPSPDLALLLAEIRGKTNTDNTRLTEGLSWAVNFIRCNFPTAEATYPDMRNCVDLVAGRAMTSGVFQLTVARAEAAEWRLADLQTVAALAWDGLRALNAALKEPDAELETARVEATAFASAWRRLRALLDNPDAELDRRRRLSAEEPADPPADPPPP